MTPRMIQADADLDPKHFERETTTAGADECSSPSDLHQEESALQEKLPGTSHASTPARDLDGMMHVHR